MLAELADAVAVSELWARELEEPEQSPSSNADATEGLWSLSFALERVAMQAVAQLGDTSSAPDGTL